MRILLVEDDASDVALLSAELRFLSSDRCVLVARQSVAAIEHLSSTSAIRPDIIVADLLLANGTSGFDVLRYLHTQSHDLDWRMLIVSAEHDRTQELIDHGTYVRANWTLLKKGGEQVTVESAVRRMSLVDDKGAVRDALISLVTRVDFLRAGKPDSVRSVHE